MSIVRHRVVRIPGPEGDPVGTQRHHLTGVPAEHTEWRRDTVTAQDETQPAGLPVATGESRDVEEFV